MPYDALDELPKGVKNNVPKHGQEIYRAAFNNAWEQYKKPENRDDPKDDRESVAHKVAWDAVKQQYYKGDDEKWHKKTGD